MSQSFFFCEVSSAALLWVLVLLYIFSFELQWLSYCLGLIIRYCYDDDDDRGSKIFPILCQVPDEQGKDAC